MSCPRIHELADIFPMMDDQGIEALAEDIRRNGLLHPIITFEGKVIDGRHRLKACKIAGVAPRFHAMDAEMKGRDPLDVVLALNVRRRNLTTSQTAMVAAAALPIWRAWGLRRREANLKRGRKRPDEAESAPRGRSSAALAKLFGVSARAIQMAASVREKDTTLADRVAAGQIRLGRAHRHLQAQSGSAEPTEDSSGDLELIHGDMQQLSGRLTREYQLILTDPPYYAEDLGLWRSLRDLAIQRLRPSGWLVAMSGIQFLPAVMTALTDEANSLHYRWCVCATFAGAHPRRHGFRMTTTWRPFLVFQKTPQQRPATQWVDRVEVTAPAVPAHPMEQLPRAFEPFVKAFSKPGDWILDPFAGSGSVLTAAHSLGRNATGCEKEKQWVQLITERLPGLRVL